MKIRSLTRKSFYDKRGLSLGDLYPVVLTIALVAILLAVVLFVLDQWQDTTATDVGTVTNESGAYVNVSGYTLGNYLNCSFNTPVITSVFIDNSITPQLLPAANYTLSDAFVLTNATATLNATMSADAVVSYTYLYGGEDCSAMENISADFVDFIPWIGVILLIVAAAIVLGIVIRSFAGGKSRV